jgi:hypothetical protein
MITIIELAAAAQALGCDVEELTKVIQKYISKGRAKDNQILFFSFRMCEL